MDSTDNAASSWQPLVSGPAFAAWGTDKAASSSRGTDDMWDEVRGRGTVPWDRACKRLCWGASGSRAQSAANSTRSRQLGDFVAGWFATGPVIVEYRRASVRGGCQEGGSGRGAGLCRVRRVCGAG